jgi:membrane protein YdbS with pleckstrin-like domain
MSLRYTFWFVIVGELFAVGAQVWLLWEKRNAPWWVFVPRTVTLAMLCGAASVAIYALWKRRDFWLARHERD